MEEIIAGWPASPSGNCDICNVPIGTEHSHAVSAAEFKGVVRQGYNPIASGRAASVQFMGAMWGVAPDAAYAGWKEMVAMDSTDWGLCEDCAKDVASFVAAHS